MKKKVKSEEKLRKIGAKIGIEELIGQLTEECCELGQAAQKVRRATKGTTPMKPSEALAMLTEETADVLNALEALTEFGVIDMSAVRKIRNQKISRWYDRTFGGDMAASSA